MGSMLTSYCCRQMATLWRAREHRCTNLRGSNCIGRPPHRVSVGDVAMASRAMALQNKPRLPICNLTRGRTQAMPPAFPTRIRHSGRQQTIRIFERAGLPNNTSAAGPIRTVTARAVSASRKQGVDRVLGIITVALNFCSYSLHGPGRRHGQERWVFLACDPPRMAGCAATSDMNLRPDTISSTEGSTGPRPCFFWTERPRHGGLCHPRNPAESSADPDRPDDQRLKDPPLSIADLALQ